MPGDDRTDADLVAAINRGPPEADGAFAAIYLRHRDFVLRIARRMTPDDASAADLAQDVFLALADQFPGFELRAKLTTYLYSVVRNRAASMARGRRPSVPIDGSAPAASAESGADAEALAALRDAVDRLPDSQREVVLMRVVDGMSVGDVAMALGVPTGTVKSRLHAALGALRAHPGLRRWFAV